MPLYREMRLVSQAQVTEHALTIPGGGGGGWWSPEGSRKSRQGAGSILHTPPAQPLSPPWTSPWENLTCPNSGHGTQ